MDLSVPSGSSGTFYAILSSGKALCWGNSAGECGWGGATSYGALPMLDSIGLPASPPAHVVGNVAKISAGPGKACVLFKDGSIECTGSNLDGTFGDGTTNSSTVPTKMTTDVNGAPVGPFIDVGVGGTGSGGWSHTCAVKSDHSVWCWGINSNGELGLNVTDAAYHVHAAQVVGMGGVGFLPPASKVALGAGYTCAILDDATVACWGTNYYGTQGQANPPPEGQPSVVPGLTGVVELVAGSSNVCARLGADNSVWCWGQFTGGGGTTPSQYIGPGNTVQIAVGASFGCALDMAGTIQCWGENGQGQLGDGTFVTPMSGKTLVTVLTAAGGPALSAVSKIVTGNVQMCALAGNGVVSCWGSDNDGELGLGVAPAGVTCFPYGHCYPSPQPVANLP